MPLPPAGTPWPPKQLAAISPIQARMDAWYVGDPDRLAAAYGGESRPYVLDRPSQYRGGVVGAVSRWFWGPPASPLAQTPRRLHVPIAADICQASADLCWAEAPTLTADTPATQEYLDGLIGDGMLTTLAEGCEVGAALGDHYLRVSWDRDTSPAAPFLTVVDADASWPEFRWGRLVGVTFWWVVRQDGVRVIRHVERHELDQGVGVVIHGLYDGTTTDLGRPVPLTEDPSTAGLAGHVNEYSVISTGSPGLAVVHVPNVTPNPALRGDPIGRHLGRSDLAQCEPMMDALDEVYSSWMRDVRLAKARLIAPASMLADAGPGKGAVFDLDQEVYEAVNSLGALRDSGSAGVQAQQFAIRFEEHRATAQQLVEDVLRRAGYSSSTFGEDESGRAATATEIMSRQQRSFLTRDRKLRILRPRIADAIEKLLHVHVALGFPDPPAPERPDVEFPDGVQDSALTLAQTAQALRSAEAASTRTLVEMVHPEWDAQRVDNEVALILDETPAPGPLPDPASPLTVPGTAPAIATPQAP